MTRILKRCLALVIVLAAAIFLVTAVKGLLQYPHLYLDLRRLELRNVLFLGAALLSLALSAVAAIYLVFNADGRIWDIVLSLLCCLVLGLGGYLFIAQGLKNLPCTFTTSLSDYETEFNPEIFRFKRQNLFPDRDNSLVSGYTYYENGDTKFTQVIRTYEKEWAYQAEIYRLQGLGMESFEEDSWTCYRIRTGQTLFQAQVDDKTKQISYSRYDRPDERSGLIPAPLEPTPEQKENLRPTAETEAQGDT